MPCKNLLRVRKNTFCATDRGAPEASAGRRAFSLRASTALREIEDEVLAFLLEDE